VSLDASDLQLQSKAQGGWMDASWQGKISQLTLNQPQFGLWSNEQDIKLQANAQQLKLENACLVQQKARLCTILNLATANSQITANMTDFPLNPLQYWLAEDTSLTGNIDGNLQLAGPLNALKGKVQLELQRGQLALTADEDENYQLDLSEGVMNLLIAPQQNSAELRLKAGEGAISAKASTGPFSTTASTPVKGTLNADLPNLQSQGSSEI